MSKSTHQVPATAIGAFAADEEQEKLFASKEKAKIKVHELLQTMKLETENYARTIAAQIRAVAYVNGVLTKTTPLIYEGRRLVT